jgi:hypothetical protein
MQDREVLLARRKKDFTPDAIYKELSDYTLNQNYPEAELDEIGGSHVSCDGITDVEIQSVTKSGSDFIVEGSATLEITTDLGEGDSFPDCYPMTFSYEFDDDGKIVRQLSRHIDTSSFFAGNDDYESYLVESSGHQTAFQTSVMDILSLLAQPPEAPPHQRCLHRVLYVNVVTVLECYLSDFFISRIKEDNKLLRKLIETTPFFKDQKTTVSEVFQTMDAIEKRANKYLFGLLWHRLDDVSKLYKKVLGVTFPSDMNALHSAIVIRHELVHRNGKKQDETEHQIGEAEIKSVIKLAEELVGQIEKGWLDVSSAGGLKASPAGDKPF